MEVLKCHIISVCVYIIYIIHIIYIYNLFVHFVGVWRPLLDGNICLHRRARIKSLVGCFIQGAVLPHYLVGLPCASV